MFSKVKVTLIAISITFIGCAPINQCILHSTKPLGKSLTEWNMAISVNSQVQPSIDLVDTVSAVSYFDQDKIISLPFFPNYSVSLLHGLNKRTDIGGQLDLTLVGAGASIFYKYCISNPEKRFRINSFIQISGGLGLPFRRFAGSKEATGVQQFIISQVGVPFGYDLDDKYEFVVTPTFKFHRVYGAGSLTFGIDSLGNICNSKDIALDVACRQKEVAIIGFPYIYNTLGLSATIIRTKSTYFELNIQRVIFGFNSISKFDAKSSPLMYSIAYKCKF